MSAQPGSVARAGAGAPKDAMATHRLDFAQTPPAGCRGGVVSIGNFDGVHRGHLALLAELRRGALAHGVPAVAVTFDPHPLQLLRPGSFEPLLSTPQDRAALLQANGADEVVILRTTPPLLALSPREFFEQVIGERLEARGLVEGLNFGFGRGREGDVDTLRALCRKVDIQMTVVDQVVAADGTIVSSSRVRAALDRGDVRRATNLLGRPYHLTGTVRRGVARGQALGFPTANLNEIRTLVPRDGVYAVRVENERDSWAGAANVGPNPTFGENVRKVEVHLIGFAGDLYGCRLALNFLERLRDTRPFASPTLLVEQLRRDVEQAGQVSLLAPLRQH